MTVPADPIPAATLVLFRTHSASALPELLMIERGAKMVFAAGALVFPGGRVDPGDRALATTLATVQAGHAILAARIAAIRETIEEVGIAVGIVPAPDAGAVDRLRAGLAAGRDFATLLASEGMRIDPAAAVPFARWCPNFRESRNFDTLFFLAAAPPDAVAIADGGESVRAIWATAAAFLADADAGHHRVIFPTRRNLEWLARFSSIEAARAEAAGRSIETITPWIEERDGERWICIPEDRGYPVTAERLSVSSRG